MQRRPFRARPLSTGFVVLLAALLALGGLSTLAGSAAAANAASIEVQTNGTGEGRVTSAPNGIDCPGTCQETFPDTSPGPFSLTVTKTGTGTGTVTSAPAGISCGADCDEAYAAGTLVTLTAAPGASFVFTGWSGGGCTGTGTCTVTMNAATSVTATFASASYSLSVAKAGPGTGLVVSTPAGINCGATCTATWLSGSPVTLTATPSGGSSFAGWSGGGCTGTGPCTVTVTANTTVTALFTLPAFTLTVNKLGTGAGTVTSTPAGINCGSTCIASYNAGTPVSLSAGAAIGSTFMGWSGACSGTGACVVTMSAANSVTATFDVSAPGFTVTTGYHPASTTGTIVVTLTAIPASGSYFAGWSGGTCGGTAPTCTLSFADDGHVSTTAVTLVVATFNRIAHPGGGQGGPSNGEGRHRHHHGCGTDPGFNRSKDPSCRHGHRHHHHHHRHHHRAHWRY